MAEEEREERRNAGTRSGGMGKRGKGEKIEE